MTNLLDPSSKTNHKDANRIISIIHCHLLAQVGNRASLRSQGLNMYYLKMTMTKIDQILILKICASLATKVTKDSSNQLTLELTTMVLIRCQRINYQTRIYINHIANKLTITTTITIIIKSRINLTSITTTINCKSKATMLTLKTMEEVQI
jgi:hypothetical protein